MHDGRVQRELRVVERGGDQSRLECRQRTGAIRDGEEHAPVSVVDADDPARVERDRPESPDFGADAIEQTRFVCDLFRIHDGDVGSDARRHDRVPALTERFDRCSHRAVGQEGHEVTTNGHGRRVPIR